MAPESESAMRVPVHNRALVDPVIGPLVPVKLPGDLIDVAVDILLPILDQHLLADKRAVLSNEVAVLPPEADQQHIEELKLQISHRLPSIPALQAGGHSLHKNCLREGGLITARLE